MVFPPAALIEITGGKGGKEEENGKNSVESLHATLEVQRTEENTAVGRGAEEEEEDGKNTPLRYVPLSDVYSATSPCVSSASGGSKKVKPPHHQHWKPLDHFGGHDHHPPKTHELSSSIAVMNSNSSYNSNAGRRKPPITHFYTRRDKGKRKHEENEEREKEPLNSDMWQNSRLEGLNSTVSKPTEQGFVEESGELVPKRRKKRKSGGYELVNLGVDSSAFVDRDGSGLREAQNTNVVGSDVRNKSSSVEISSFNNNSGEMRRRKNKADTENEVKQSGSLRKKKWVWLSFSGVDPMKFVGLECKVFWPLDADWYRGRVIGYDFETRRHNVEYDDGDKEKLMLSNERVKFYLSSEEMQHLKLKLTDKSSEADGIDVDEMVVLAASLDDCQELEPGDIIWAKLTGHAMWPAVVLDESLVAERLGLNKHAGEKSVLVQFFGTHDFARVKQKQVISFLKGLLSSFHLKCRKPNFVRSLEEAKMYLSEQKLPKRMLRLRDGSQDDDCSSHGGEEEGSADSGEACGGTIRSFPFDVGDLQIVNLGRIVKDSDNFHDEKFIWPEGYTALRKFPSITDPSVYMTYKMEVLRDDAMRSRPLFRVTSENGEQFSGSTPSACWNKIYKRIRKIQPDGLKAEDGSERVFESGVDMFGFSHPEISKLIEELSTSRFRSKAPKMVTAKCQDHPPGYRPVDVTWRDLDKCNVCHMDEEYENNVFLQCEKCRMMVHARCYGELEPLDGVLWLCNLCRPGAPEFPPRCCLCPVTGGAMKPTTDGRWAHLACAIWIPETCLSDIKKMEPIDGLSRINKDRWKLLCSICGVAYGACIQCSNNSCRVAYHPLCARVAGFCVELEDEDRLHLIPLDEDEEDQCIRLLSFCKRHRPPSNSRPAAEERIRKAFDFSDYTPPINPSGCARTEPYNHFGRRGRKEPEVLAAASLKRLYVENRPHLVGGFSHHDPFGSNVSSRKRAGSEYSVDLHNMKISKLDVSGSILSKAEKYRYMRETFRKRLAFGKSGIHGFGIFARHPHKAGDMVIEYTGELVRPSIADRREHLIYNSLVGAGTYMFRINDERVIDATRAGSIAHLINHSCEPNCYSRVISVNGDEHIIIFAKRDIEEWEELTYDYRFVATDEQLACYCGFPRCRGVVNDPEAEERASKLYVPRSELIEWRGE